MTPKEKAQDICDKMGFIKGEIMAINYMSKRYSIVAVDEILNSIDFSTMLNGVDDYNYWLDVKKEIENIYNESISDALSKLIKKM